MRKIKAYLIQFGTSFLVRIFYLVLRNQEIQHLIWKSANTRPHTPEMFYASLPNSVDEECYKLATRQSAEYVLEHMNHLEAIQQPLDVLSFCVQQVSCEGLFLEFGVYCGLTINHIASLVPEKEIHGFDSFRGLPEKWNGAKKGTFDIQGKLPPVKENVRLHVGWFEETLSSFKESFPENIAFIHIDSDLYSSAHTILFTLKEQIQKGTIIVFDEYYNYPGWRKHEYLAFKEFIEETKYKYEYIAFCGRGFSVGVRIL